MVRYQNVRIYLTSVNPSLRFVHIKGRSAFIVGVSPTMFRTPFCREPRLFDLLPVASNGNVSTYAVDRRDNVAPIAYLVPCVHALNGGQAQRQLRVVVRGANVIRRKVRDQFISRFVACGQGREVNMFHLIIYPGYYVMGPASKSIRVTTFDDRSTFEDPSFDRVRRPIGCQIENFGGGVIPGYLFRRDRARNVFLVHVHDCVINVFEVHLVGYEGACFVAKFGGVGSATKGVTSSGVYRAVRPFHQVYPMGNKVFQRVSHCPLIPSVFRGRFLGCGEFNH